MVSVILVTLVEVILHQVQLLKHIRQCLRVATILYVMYVQKKFQLADNIKIKEATLKNGLLNIDLLKILPKEVKKEIINIIEK